MPWCPKCKVEYREGFNICSDCDCELVEKLEEEIRNGVEESANQESDSSDDDHEDLLTSVADEIEANVLESILNSYGIPILKKYPGTGGYRSFYMGNSNSGINIFVPSRLLGVAKELIDKENIESAKEQYITDENIEEDNIVDENEEDNNVLTKNEDELFNKEIHKAQRKNSLKIWILFSPGILITIIYLLIRLFKSL